MRMTSICSGVCAWTLRVVTANMSKAQPHVRHDRARARTKVVQEGVSCIFLTYPRNQNASSEGSDARRLSPSGGRPTINRSGIGGHYFRANPELVAFVGE